MAPHHAGAQIKKLIGWKRRSSRNARAARLCSLRQPRWHRPTHATVHTRPRHRRAPLARNLAGGAAPRTARAGASCAPQSRRWPRNHLSLDLHPPTCCCTSSCTIFSISRAKPCRRNFSATQQCSTMKVRPCSACSTRINVTPAY